MEEHMPSQAQVQQNTARAMAYVGNAMRHLALAAQYGHERDQANARNCLQNAVIALESEGYFAEREDAA
jgi:hypothetical protein